MVAVMLKFNSFITSTDERLTFCLSHQILGLDICAETIVGDAMNRGISGGQKKRLTTGTSLTNVQVCRFDAA